NYQQENVCQLLITKFKDVADDEGRETSIDIEVTEDLSTIFESRDLTSITVTMIEAFEYLTYPASYEIRQLLYEKKNPYPGLFRLLDHNSSDVVLHAIKTIVSILNGGLGTTNDEEQNPHFQSVEECGGIQKLFSLFQTTSDKTIRDKAAVSMGRLFKARPIQDKEMQQSIISHLKPITSDVDEWTRSQSILAIQYLAQNEDNYTEIMKGFDPLAVIQDLRLPIIGNEEERKQIQHKKNLDCVLLQLIIYKVEDDNTILQNLIEAGIIEVLLYFFESQDLNMISVASVKIFDKIQSSAKTQIEQLKIEKKYYPGILRLLRSSDLNVLNDANNFIANDFAIGADQAQDAIPNPLFEEISECGGIEIIFDLFQRNLDKNTRNNSANLLIMLFVNQEFSNELMRKEIIHHFINPLINTNNDKQEINNWDLKQIAKVVGNHAEILKDDFIAQAIQAMSNNSKSFLFEFLENIVDAEQNSHFQSVEEFGGIQKLFTLFQTTSVKDIKDKIAVSLGRLYKARPIQDKEMQQSIISHLKSITSDVDEWTRSQSILAIQYLAQNEDNYTEIMKGFDPLAVIQDLRLPIIGNEEERKQIQHKKNLDCVLLQLIIYKVEDDNTILQNLIEAGIIEVLLYFFESQDLNMISVASVKIFDKIQSSAKTQIEQLKIEKKYYPGILRLLRSSDLNVLNDANNFIANDFAIGADQAQDAIPNPLFEEISECGGIEIIFDLLLLLILLGSYRIIGRGRFGTVSSYQEIKTQRIVAIKECDYDTDELISMMNREIEVMKDIIRIIRSSTHQSQFIHVVEPLGFFVNEDEEKAYLVMELCSGGDLRGYIRNLQKMGSEISAQKCWEFASSIVSAVYQLHVSGILHMDLKPENVLLTEDIKVKLADFGLSRKLQQGKDYMTHHGGTKFYLPPELLQIQSVQTGAEGRQLHQKRQQTKAADIWAIGIMLYELLAQHHPFIGNDDESADLSELDVAHRIVTEEAPELPAHYPDSLRKLIKAMLQKDPSRRITAEEILSIPEVAANLGGQ
ncbi:MAG: putative NEK protein kinase, partial [Streblomastix strix]